MTIGTIGTGWGARVQVPAFRSAGLAVQALAGSDPAKTTRTAEELGVAFATSDWRALLARPDVALVSIVTPPHLHREMALAALAAGKHVLCEKPTALSAAEAEEMLAAAQARPAQLALIDHELRFLPALRLARQLVAEGAIGPVRLAEARVIGAGRSDAARPWSWWNDAAKGGGILGAIGSHQIDTLRYLLADEVAAAHGLTAVGVAERPGPDGAPTPVTADDIAAGVLRFGSGALATLILSVVASASEPSSLTLYGAAGTLRFSGGRLLQGDAGGELRDITPPHSVRIPDGISGDFPEGTVYLGHALAAALAGDTAALAPAATFADGLANQRVVDALRG
jgi:predicted dehydrogenase